MVTTVAGVVQDQCLKDRAETLLKKSVLLTLVIVMVGSLSSCGGGGSSAAVEATTTTTQKSTTTLAPTTTVAPTTQAPKAPSIMPDVVGMNLQAAQDLIQTTGVFFSKSVDCTGRDRMQILDRDWQVVSQTPAPGAAFGEDEAVLGVVKLGESNAVC
jgi:hypothetical protein